MFGGSRTSPIGIDLADDRIQLTQLRRVRGDEITLQAFGGWNWSLAPHGPVDLEDIRRQAELVAEVVRKGRFVGRRVVVRVPDKLLQMKNVRIPPIPDEDLPEATKWEAAERFQIDPEASVIRYYDVGMVSQGSETKREVILLAAPTDPLLELARALDGVGFDLLSFDPTPTLLTRFQRVIEHHGMEDAEDLNLPRLIIQVSPEHTWVFISERGRVVFLRQMAFGTKDFEEQTAPIDRSGSDDGTYGLRVPLDREEAERRGPRKRVDLAQEVALCLRYYGVTFPGKRPEAAWLIAPETIARRLGPSLAERASVRVMLPHEFDDRLPRLYDAIGRPLASMASSIGLAMNWPGGRLVA